MAPFPESGTVGDNHHVKARKVQAPGNLIFFSLLLLTLTPCAFAQEPEPDTAVVEIDGETLFRVQGTEAHPAAARAARIVDNIEAIAADRTVDPASLRLEEHGTHTRILSGSSLVMGVTDPDAEINGFPRSLLATAYTDRIRKAIIEYRQARTSERLTASVGRAALVFVIAAAAIALVLWLLRKGEAAFQRRFERRAGTLGTEARRILRVEAVWRGLVGIFRVARVAAVLLVGVIALQYVLTQFPWTRGAGLHLFKSISSPMETVLQKVVGTIPNLLFLGILALLTRYALSLAKLYFDAVEHGGIRLQNFEPEWAIPTYNIIRVAVIGFALVIAYPLIPGSDSTAFKGLSILAGVMLSLSSTSSMANAVAGYMIIFRRAFRVGDRVKIGDVQGIVTDMRMQATHIQTPKNEKITIPNAMILGMEVTNYSDPARQGKLILHTEVGIGYEIPWRQVESMLIASALRTPNLLKDPPPFVMQLKLGDFAIVYQINAYCDRTEGVPLILADLHRNILDEFNEQGVQIMTPAYESDPETPKIVEKANWFPPAKEKEAGVPANPAAKVGGMARRA